MTKQEKIQYIISIIKQQVVWAEEAYIQAEADLASDETGNRLWEKDNDYGMGWGGSPYNVKAAKQRRDEKRKHLKDTKEVLDFTTNTFLSMIPEDENG